MGVFKDKKKWKAQIYVEGKRVASKGGFSGKREAKQWHDTTLGLIRSGKLEEPSPKVRFDDVLNFFIETHLPTLRRGTADRYLIDIKYRIRPVFGQYTAADISITDLELFRSELCNSISIKSANNCLALLKGIFSKAEKWGMVKVNPAIGIALLKVPQAKYSWWENEEDVSRFVESIRDDKYCLAYRLALDFGMRLGEIIGLSKADICLKRCQIHVYRQWLDKEHRYGPTKGNSERFISFPGDSELSKLIEAGVVRVKHDEALFVTRTGKRLGARKLAGYYFPLAIKRAGVPRIRFHDLRHTFASWYMIKYDDIWSLKGILGHADVQTTQKYAHLSSRYLKVPSFDWRSLN